MLRRHHTTQTHEGTTMTKIDFNNIVIRHKGRTISIAQHWSRTSDGDFLNAQEIADIDDLRHCEDYDPIRFDDTIDGLINALQAIKKDIDQ